MYRNTKQTSVFDAKRGVTGRSIDTRSTVETQISYSSLTSSQSMNRKYATLHIGNMDEHIAKSNRKEGIKKHFSNKSLSKFKPKRLWLSIRAFLSEGICGTSDKDVISDVNIISPEEQPNISTKSKSTQNESDFETHQPQSETSRQDHNKDDRKEVCLSIGAQLTRKESSNCLSSSSSSTSTGDLDSILEAPRPRRRGIILDNPSEMSISNNSSLHPFHDSDVSDDDLANSEMMPRRRGIIVDNLSEMSVRNNSSLHPLQGGDTSQQLVCMVRGELGRDWLSSFRRLDPRYKILRFFSDVAREGVDRIEEADYTIREAALVPSVLQTFTRAAAFSVWRPTSKDAIRKMMTGEGTGKGLDVKGKSAKKGVLSGFIPFLQIHEEKHKKEVRWPPMDGSIRIYYTSEAARNRAVTELTSVSNEMEAIVFEAKLFISKKRVDEEQHEMALENLRLDVTDPKVHLLNDYAPLRFGIVVAERVFFNTYISRQDITRCSEYSTGRPSEPAFQDMNFTCIRKYKGEGPRAVVLQLSEAPDDALSSKSLVVAYEEYGKVTPVASDFDCFLVGTRGVSYETSLPREQVELLKWLVAQMETILDSPSTSASWTSRWLEVLKESAAKGFYPEMPEFGYGDPKSYAIMKHVVGRLKDNGAVRHGAECFNYYFPQELDDTFLVVCDNIGGGAVPWKYVNVKELQDMLCSRIDCGYTFPLNPKWILADRGWKAVYDKMMSSKNESIQNSLAVWYPEDSGIRELIEDIHTRFPDGFQRLDLENGNEDVKTEGTEAWDLAEQQLKRHLAVRRAKLKIRVALLIMRLGRKAQT